MGRVYSASFENVTVSASQDFFEILPATQKPVILHACYLSQSSDVGDAAEEMLRVKIIRGHTTSGSGGSAINGVPLDPDGAADAATVEANNTTIASLGTAVDLHADAFNIRTGWVYLPAPEDRPVVKNAETLVVRLMAAPADALSMSGTIIYEEI